VRLLVFFAFLPLLFGCGYRLGQGDSLLSGRSISIPYVQGDYDGNLTAAVIKELTSSSDVRYQNELADLLLKIEVVDYDEENIGFRYDRTRHDRIKKYIIPVETRASLAARVELWEPCSGNLMLGPVIIKASIDFDHDYYSSRHGVNIFSLGQLTDIDTAEDTVRKPLNDLLAEKIADYLINAG